jgi:hypothetical protein
METLIKVRFKFPSKSASDVAQSMLSDDPPIFEEDVPSEYASIFRAFEFLPEPDELKKVSNVTLDALYEVGSNGLQQLGEAIEELSSLEGMKVFMCHTYEEEIYLSAFLGGTLQAFYNTDAIVESAGVKVDYFDDLKWASKLFSYIDKNNLKP